MEEFFWNWKLSRNKRLLFEYQFRQQLVHERRDRYLSAAVESGTLDRQRDWCNAMGLSIDKKGVDSILDCTSRGQVKSV